MKVCICSIVKLTWILYFWADTSLHLLPLNTSVTMYQLPWVHGITPTIGQWLWLSW